MTVTRRGVVVGDLNRADAEHLLAHIDAGQHDAHCAEPRRIAGLAARAALAAAVPTLDAGAQP